MARKSEIFLEWYFHKPLTYDIFLDYQINKIAILDLIFCMHLMTYLCL